MTQNSEFFSIQPADGNTVRTLACPSGSTLISGGYQKTLGIVIDSSNPNLALNRWEVAVHSNSGVPNETVLVQIICGVIGA